ncbi:MAG: ABC transporter ATP-binding protein [Gemmatimonadales bacterium]|nr:MAG: ABC transporter ATP-binding protein [Gemmatimonadales bacterium]
MDVLELKGIERTYRTGTVEVKALRGVDLTVAEAEFLAIMGPSGSGKSTLMNILGCLDSPTAGQYLLNGRDVATLKRGQLAQIRNETLGFVFQAFHLLPRTTASENVELPLLYRDERLSWKQIRDRAREALEVVGLGDRLHHTPTELSGGQKQRVAIARALVTKPRVLLADEPTGNLDTRTSLEIIELIQRLNDEGLTILMVTHEPEIARFAERVVILRDGLLRSDRRRTPLRAADHLADWSEESEDAMDEALGDRMNTEITPPVEVGP